MSSLIQFNYSIKPHSRQPEQWSRIPTWGQSSCLLTLGCIWSRTLWTSDTDETHSRNCQKFVCDESRRVRIFCRLSCTRCPAWPRRTPWCWLCWGNTCNCMFRRHTAPSRVCLELKLEWDVEFIVSLMYIPCCVVNGWTLLGCLWTAHRNIHCSVAVIWLQPDHWAPCRTGGGVHISTLLHLESPERSE